MNRDFLLQHAEKVLTDFAAQEAQKKGLVWLRLDTDVREGKLRRVYEDLGFRFMGTQQQDARTTAFYQKSIL